MHRRRKRSWEEEAALEIPCRTSNPLLINCCALVFVQCPGKFTKI